MIDAICTTNLDGYKCTITKFCAVPRIGESVTVYGLKGALKVVKITHSVRYQEQEPYIIVELG